MHFVRLRRAVVEAAEPAAGVGLPAALRVLAVVDDVDAALDLLAHDLVDRLFDARLEGVVHRVVVADAPAWSGAGRPAGEGCRRGSEDSVGAAFHGSPSTVSMV